MREECLTAPRRPVRQTNGRGAGQATSHANKTYGGDAGMGAAEDFGCGVEECAADCDRCGEQQRVEAENGFGAGCPQGEGDEDGGADADGDGSGDSAGDAEGAVQCGLAEAEDDEGDELEDEGAP